MTVGQNGHRIYMEVAMEVMELLLFILIIPIANSEVSKYSAIAFLYLLPCIHTILNKHRYMPSFRLLQ
jgi:hypothetical protein